MEAATPIRGKVVLLVHGIRVRDGARSGVAGLREYFEEAGWKVVVVSYGYFFLIRSRLCNGPVAAVIACFVMLLDELGFAVVAVGHSNGAAILARASMLGAPFRVLAFVNAALDRTPKIGKQVRAVLNYHVRTDHILAIAAVLPFNEWGDLGRVGFPPDSYPALWNVDLSDPANWGGEAARDHNDALSAQKRVYFGPRIVDAVEIHGGFREAA